MLWTSLYIIEHFCTYPRGNSCCETMSSCWNFACLFQPGVSRKGQRDMTGTPTTYPRLELPLGWERAAWGVEENFLCHVGSCAVGRWRRGVLGRNFGVEKEGRLLPYRIWQAINVRAQVQSTL